MSGVDTGGCGEAGTGGGIDIGGGTSTGTSCVGGGGTGPAWGWLARAPASGCHPT
ncbi:hypothetical protein [Goodfellowiella coeruleoviolacea]|uniref:hypothetical protein n=1 Tax=Goodfellowiella coeruleoviolacea TaxID=334858 RepID=UPI0020A49985|nr:hypothetical protein [Goodfellowiella coeruleoviolacea]